ncbi:MAG: N-formylglutamate amidohydrolase [Pseudomonadota bacterium]
MGHAKAAAMKGRGAAGAVARAAPDRVLEEPAQSLGSEPSAAQGARAGAFALTDPPILRSGAVFSSPHSGRAYSEAFIRAARLDPMRLRASEDAFVDLLFAAAARQGAPMLAAVAPRAFVDLNRCPQDLDPALLEGAARKPINARVAAGLGVVPRIVAEGVPIYDGKLPIAEAEARIAAWHAPYHEALASLLLRARRRFGRALLLDCHSMPSGASGGRRRAAPADVVLGDRFGVSAEPHFVDAIEAAFTEAGFRVERNSPFAGGYITERFGRPRAGVSAVQIELDRGLYLDAETIAPSPRFAEIVERLEPVIAAICAMIDEATLAESDSAAPDSLAAE